MKLKNILKLVILPTDSSCGHAMTEYNVHSRILTNFVCDTASSWLLYTLQLHFMVFLGILSSYTYCLFFLVKKTYCIQRNKVKKEIKCEQKPT